MYSFPWKRHRSHKDKDKDYPFQKFMRQTQRPPTLRTIINESFKVPHEGIEPITLQQEKAARRALKKIQCRTYNNCPSICHCLSLSLSNYIISMFFTFITVYNNLQKKTLITNQIKKQNKLHQILEL